MTCKEMILSNDFLDIIADYEVIEEQLAATDAEYCYHVIDGGYGVANVRRSQVPPVSVGYYGYSSLPKLYGLMQMGEVPFDASPLSAMGNIQVQNPPLALQGSGVIMGFIDTGIRYQEDVFRREDGSTRIISIWDQTIQTGEPPEGFEYGTEYRRADIDRALASENPLSAAPTTDENGHGTRMASAAAGSLLNQGLNFRGAAPLADIAVVKLKEAKAYLREYYLVDSQATVFQENDTVAGRRSRAVVVGGGNEGDREHHYEHSMPSNVEIRVEKPMKGFCVELWGDLPDAYSVAIRSPGGETTPIIDFRNGLDRNLSFIFERTKIQISSVLVEKDSGDPMIFMRFSDPTPGIWTISVTSSARRMRGRGMYHMWLPIQAFLEGDVTFLTPSPDVTLTEPANASEVITVSAYNSYTDGWYAPSGRGYSRSGGIKPDLAAPGVGVPTVLGATDGSCMAAALAAGCVAQFLEWAVVDGNAYTVDNRGTKSYLIQGADRSGNVVYPDRQWGYGRININGTFETLARL